jgi:hypothetical protein
VSIRQARRYGPRSPRKGDLDLLVRVDAGDFDAAVAGLRGPCAVDRPENWTATFASFTDPQAADPPVGVQLAVAGSADDALFGPLGDALVGDPTLLAEYHAQAPERRRGLRALHRRQGRVRRTCARKPWPAVALRMALHRHPRVA